MISSPRAALEALVSTPGLTRIDPPILMSADPYFDLAGEEFRRRLVLTSGVDGEEYCLRPDFTLPIARHYLENGVGEAAYSYLGTLFRQRPDGPAEFDQTGLELIGQPDPAAALDRVIHFARDVLMTYGVTAPRVRIGSVALFEAVLAGAEMPDVWRPRLRHRFGHAGSLDALLERLSDPHGAEGNIRTPPLAEIETDVAGRMAAAGLPFDTSRAPAEIAARYLEKQALAAAYVPGETIQLLTDYLGVAGPVETALATIGGLIETPPAGFEVARAAIRRHFETLGQCLPGAEIVFDAGFAPRLDYYTGLVFEMTGEDGAVLASGGEYDRLLQRLGAGREIAASGCALWVDRLEKEGGK
ncbi:MAG: ATP phosphoribosyltransferase regulatory subunit [Alphaproteobacteria bacterium]|nr:ATP phosphoribosyltransferase regulatory subunit [Alphaproteobacteria bacterium]